MTKPIPTPLEPAKVLELAQAVVKADRFRISRPWTAISRGCVRFTVRTDGFVYVARLRYHRDAKSPPIPRSSCAISTNIDRVRITGVAEIVTDRPLLQEIWDANPLLRQYLGSLDNQC